MNCLFLDREDIKQGIVKIPKKYKNKIEIKAYILEVEPEKSYLSAQKRYEEQ